MTDEKNKPQIVEVVEVGGVTFECFDDGREVAYRDGKILAGITPNGEGWGGWVYWLGGEPRQRFDRYNLVHVDTRAEGREIVAGWNA